MTKQKASMSDKMKISRDTNKKKTFTKYMQEKLAITVLVITLALLALVGVLYRIIKENNESYNQIILSNQDYDSRVIPYRRGDIVDRNGTYMATSEKVYNLIIDPKQLLLSPEGSVDATLTALVNCFGYDRDELAALIEEKKDKNYVRYARQLTYDQREAFLQLQSETNKANQDNKVKARVKGIWFEDEYKRIYPYTQLGCNVIGFAQSDGAGGSGGIEQYYNSYLIGNNGREYGYLNDDSNLERVIKSPENGKTIVSTIDSNIQGIVEKYINQWQTETGSKTTAVVVMDPNNGEVLAMSSDRMYDLNNPREIGGRYTDDEIIAMGVTDAVRNFRKNKEKNPTGHESITEDQVYEHYSRDEVYGMGQQVAWNQIWRNYCISDTYEPGSPSKIFTVAGALEEGVINGTETFDCQGKLQVTDREIHCVKRSGHGLLTVQEGLMQSCNVVMMDIALKTGMDRYYKYQQMFGFGTKTGIDLPGEADTSTLVHNAKDAVPADLATNSFGQTYTCTMIQMAAAYCSVINGGSYYEPHVVKQILNEQGSVVEKKDPVLVQETVSQSTSDFIRTALYRTVEEGTGKAAQVPGYEICGKTGTAEKLPRKNGKYLVSFAGFAPRDNPQVLVYVIIDEPNVEDQAHSSFASAIFQKIMTEILPYMNVFPATEDVGTPSEVLQAQQEGISGGDNATGEDGQTPEETAVQETKIYETDEYVDQGTEEGSGLPDDVPTAEETQETEAETKKAVSPSAESQTKAKPKETTAAPTEATTTAPETVPAATEPPQTETVPPISPLG